jgi:hypothetical protein
MCKLIADYAELHVESNSGKNESQAKVTETIFASVASQ